MNTAEAKARKQSYRAVYYAANSEKIKAQAAAYRAANTEKCKTRTAVYYASHSSKVKARSAAWSRDNPEKVRARSAAWSRDNPDKRSAKEARRRAAKLQATPAWADREKIAMIYAKAQEWGMVVDHVVPLKNKIVCGLHTWENFQLLCGPENSRKSNSHWPDMPENIRSKTK